MRWLVLVLGLACGPATAEGLALVPWSGDLEVGAVLDEGVKVALRRVHPRVVEVRGACDVDCARALRVDAVVTRAARSGLTEPVCVEVKLKPLGGDEARVFAVCRVRVDEVAQAIEAELTAALRGPLRPWEGGVEDIRETWDDEPDAEPTTPERNAPKTPANGLVTAGAWTVGIGTSVATLGIATSLGLLTVLNDPAADRSAKDFALNTGRTSLFVGLSLGVATAATGAFIWGLGLRESQ